jgi:hypothetical protein
MRIGFRGGGEFRGEWGFCDDEYSCVYAHVHGYDLWGVWDDIQIFLWEGMVVCGEVAGGEGGRWWGKRANEVDEGAEAGIFAIQGAFGGIDEENELSWVGDASVDYVTYSVDSCSGGNTD